jgi:uncharacterized membrane protein YhaH (DUF805 family)
MDSAGCSARAYFIDPGQVVRKGGTMNWYVEVLKKYAVFEGRARRSEYWFFFLFNFLISLGISIVVGVLSSAAGVDLSFLSFVYALAVLIPSIAVAVRRLHDTDRSGWWILISLIPCVGTIILLVFLVQDSTPGPNRFGANPKMM